MASGNTEAAMVTKVTSKGQVTIPKAVRDRLGIQLGSAVDFRVSDNGSVVLEKAVDRDFAATVEKWRGRADSGLSTDEIMALTRGD